MPLRKKTKNIRRTRRHILDVKLRSSQRRSLRFRVAALLLLVLGLVGLGGLALQKGGSQLLQQFIYDNPAFAIHKLDIQTDGVLSTEQLQRWSGVSAEDNLFSLDLKRVQRDLEMVPLIRSASVERALPHTLRIRVAEREPVAEVNFRKPGGLTRYLLDAEGCVMFPLENYELKASTRTNVRYPGLVGVRSSDLQPGQAARSEQVQAALKLVGVFNRSPMVGVERMELIDVRSPGVLSATTDQGTMVTFASESFEPQLVRWRAIHDHGLRIGRRLSTLDLSVTNNLPALWIRTGAAPSSGEADQSPPRKRHV